MKTTIPIPVLVLFSTLLACIGCSSGSKGGPHKHISRVEIKKVNGKYRIYKDGEPFLVKGGSGYTHLKELAEAGGNTIKTWDTLNLGSILDEAALYHLNVIVGLTIPKSEFIEEFYDDSSKTNSLIRAYQPVIQRYKNHPALLAWCVGNELDFPSRFKYKPFYRTFNKILEYIHQSDTNHPVTTTLINFTRRTVTNLKLKIPDLDFVSINSFAHLYELKKEVSDFSWFWNGPYLVTEWSPKGGWESEETAWQVPIENTSTKKAELYTAYYKNYVPLSDNRCLGSLAFYWGSKQEYTSTWFSIFDNTGSKTEVVEALHDCWNDTQTKHLSPQLEFMLLDGKGARDNNLLERNTPHEARILLKQDSNQFQYQWEIVGEDWLKVGDENRPKPSSIRGLFTDSTSTIVKFNAPEKEGPYRIFVTVRDKNGYCATANTPFYVLEK